MTSITIYQNEPAQTSSSGGGPSKGKQLSTGKKIFTVACLVVSFIVTVVVIVQNGTALGALGETSSYLQEVMENWETGVIVDMMVTTGECPDDYEAIEWTWPGTKTGCSCSSSLSAGSCSSNQTSCDTVKATNATSVSNVFDGGQSICIMREDDITFVNSAKRSPWQCEDGKRPCGNISNFETRMCIDEEVACPINNIWVETKTISETGFCSQATGCGVLESNGTHNTLLYWARDADSYAFVEFEFEEYGLCLLREHENISPGRDDYELRNPTRKSCKAPKYEYPEYFGFKPLITITEAQIMNNSGLYEDLEDDLPDFTSISKLDDYEWTLYTRTYMPWSTDDRCRWEVEPFHERADQFFALASMVIITLTISIIAGVITGLILPAMEIANLAGKDLPCFKGDGEEERKRLRKCKACTGLIFKGIQVPLFIAGTVIAFQQSDFFLKVSDMNCTTGQAEEDIDEAAEAIKKTKTSNIVSLSLILVSFLLEIYKSYKEKKDEEEEKKKARVTDISNEPQGGGSHLALNNSAMMNNSSTPFTDSGAPSEMGQSTLTGTTGSGSGFKKKKRKIGGAKARLQKQRGVEGGQNMMGMNSTFANGENSNGQQQQWAPQQGGGQPYPNLNTQSNAGYTNNTQMNNTEGGLNITINTQQGYNNTNGY